MAGTLKRLREKIDYNLRIPQYYKKTWLAILFITIFLLVFAAVAIIVVKAPTNETLVKNLASNPKWVQAACILSYISYGFIAVPYLFLSACWIVGIDNITKSKHYHLFIWAVYWISALLSLVAIIIGFRAYLVY